MGIFNIQYFIKLGRPGPVVILGWSCVGWPASRTEDGGDDDDEDDSGDDTSSTK